MPTILSTDEYIAGLLATPRPGEENILAYYEHRLGGITCNPRLMLMPTDDHLAHRGDGVFETIKYSEGLLYRLDKHLQRMRSSAEGLYLDPPCSWEQVRELVLAVAAAGKEPSGQIRLLLGRGPGGFGINPRECPASSLYIIAYRFTPKSKSWYEAGLKGFRTTIPPKQEYLARLKNVNYLPNVLMVREGNEQGRDVPFCFTEDGFLTESAVAGICLVNKQGVLEVPATAKSLPSTTVSRALELLQGKVPHVFRKLCEQDILEAEEVLMLGTGPDCVAVVEYEGRTIGQGKEGSVAALLRELIHADLLAVGVPVPSLRQK